MSPNLFTGKNVIVQGITGKNGSFHTRAMRSYGTRIVAGTSPNKAGSSLDGIPVYASVADIIRDMRVDVSVIFVPGPFAKAAIFEAIDTRIPLIVCITEHIPIHDMLQIKQHMKGKSSQLIGPNCPGVLIPSKQNLGIIPAVLSTPGDTAIVSRSGTLTYEAMDSLTKAGFGQKYIIGIGGDMVSGSSFIDCLKLFEADPEVKRIIMIGEIGGTNEVDAATYIKSHISKPVYAYVAGHTAPRGVQLGHAGAILGTNQLESAQEKTRLLQAAGAITADSLGELIRRVQ